MKRIGSPGPGSDPDIVIIVGRDLSKYAAILEERGAYALASGR